MRLAGLLAAAFCAAARPAMAMAPETDPAAVLHARYEAFYQRLDQSPFPENLEVESIEGSRASAGDVQAAIEHALPVVREAFSEPTVWCDALILHLNVKYCHPVADDDRVVLSVAIGRKHDQPLANAHRVEFVFSVTAARPDYLEVVLEAAKGPYGTGNYRIAFEAVDLGHGWSFVRLRYSYEYGTLGRLATQLYLATAGSGKVGFTVVADAITAQPKYIGGARGAIERNTMRYFLAIKAYLDTRAAPASDRFEQRLAHWFDATERYALQLHEIDRDAYLAMKRSEYARQQSVL